MGLQDLGSIKKRKGVLGHIHAVSLNYAEQVYEETFYSLI